MRRRIIALSGIANCGKTAAIVVAYEMLKSRSEVVDSGRRATKEVRAAILDVDGVKVGFASVGDLPGVLEDRH